MAFLKYGYVKEFQPMTVLVDSKDALVALLKTLNLAYEKAERGSPEEACASEFREAVLSHAEAIGVDMRSECERT